METKNLYQKICDVMKQVTTVEKGATISMGGGSYKAVSHDDVTRLLHLPLAQVGIVLAPTVLEHSMERRDYIDQYGKAKVEYRVNVVVELTAINADKPEEKLAVKMPAIAFDASDKAYGKAISMATKYCYLKLFMLESIDEEEKRPEYDNDSKGSKKTSPNNNQRTPPGNPTQNTPQNRPSIKDDIKDIQKSISEDAMKKAKDDLAKIQANKPKAGIDKEVRNIPAIKKNILDMMAVINKGKAVTEKTEFLFEVAGTRSWKDVEEKNQDELLRIESNVLFKYEDK